MWSLGRVEGAAGLSDGGSAAVEPAEHAGDRGPADHVFGDFRVRLVVTSESAVQHQPAERPFDRPAHITLSMAAFAWLVVAKTLAAKGEPAPLTT